MDEAREAHLQRILTNRKLRQQQGASDTFGASAPPAADEVPRAAATAAATDEYRPAAAADAAPASRADVAAPQLRLPSSAARKTAPVFIDPVAASARATATPAASAAATTIPVPILRKSTHDAGKQLVSPNSRNPTTSVQQPPSFLRSSESVETGRLREAQALSERKVDQLQSELRQGFSEIRQVLKTVLHEQRQLPVTAPLANLSISSGSATASGARRVMSGFSMVAGGTDQDHLVSTPRASRRGVVGQVRGGQEVQVSRPAPPHTFSAYHAAQDRQALDGATALGPLQMPSSPVIPGYKALPPFSDTSRYEELRAQARHGGADITTTPFSYDRLGDNRNNHARDIIPVDTATLPSPPPAAARPFSKTTIDIKSAMVLLHEGDWWYKWDATGAKVSLRWVWLDNTRRAISWSPQQLTAAPLFGPRIPIEEFVNVTTTQVQESDPYGNPRVFHVLRLECTSRVLQLGTERRDKLDLWCEAFQAVIYTVNQSILSQLSAAASSD